MLLRSTWIVALSLMVVSCAQCAPTPEASGEVVAPPYETLAAFWAPYVDALEATRNDEEPAVIPLWPQGAPGFEARRDEPEEAESYWVRNVHSPSLLAYLPERAHATGESIIIFPGGGYREIVIDVEGNEPARSLQERGIAAFVLKYRLSPYALEEQGRQDAERAVRIVRSLPEALGLDPQRIGAMGFSAGGSVIGQSACRSGGGDVSAVDVIERVPAQPNFIVLGYPGIRGFPDALPADAPPAYLIATEPDSTAVHNVRALAERYEEAGINHRMEIFPTGRHGFAFGQHHEIPELKAWPTTMLAWLAETQLPQR